MALAALAALAAAGCSGDGDADDEDGKGGDAAKGGKGPSASRTASPSPSPSVTAADGSDTGACADGDCEITVSKPVTFSFKGPDGKEKLSVTKVGPDEVDYTVKRSGGGTVKGGAGGPGSGCISALRPNGGGTSCGQVGKPPAKEDGAVLVQVASGKDGTAVINIISG